LGERGGRGREQRGVRRLLAVGCGKMGLGVREYGPHIRSGCENVRSPASRSKGPSSREFRIRSIQ
jgi:hypothetical protein